jgi:hypothetical protein
LNRQKVSLFGKSLQNEGAFMACQLCASDNEAEFTSEMNIHFRGLTNIDNPGVMVFPKVLICLDCGGSRFSTPQAELSQLARGAAPGVGPMPNASEGAVHRRRIALRA